MIVSLLACLCCVVVFFVVVFNFFLLLSILLPGGSMSQARSESFDSVNTTTSAGTERPLIQKRSNSMDSLILKKSHSSNEPHSKSNRLKGRENGKTYRPLVGSDSVTTSVCDRNMGFSHSYPEATPPSTSTSKSRPSPREGVASLRSQSGNDLTAVPCVTPVQDSPPRCRARRGLETELRNSKLATQDQDTNLHPYLVSIYYSISSVGGGRRRFSNSRGFLNYKTPAFKDYLKINKVASSCANSQIHVYVIVYNVQWKTTIEGYCSLSGGRGGLMIQG